jgi:site-specific recombinase XerD
MTSLSRQARPVEILTPDEVRLLIGACSAWAPTGIRNRALIALLYRSGLRIGEALALFPITSTSPASS